MNTKLLALGTLGIATVTIATHARPGGHRGEVRPDPENVVAEIVADYDANTDNLITSNELANAIVGMHEKRIAEMKARLEDSDRERPESPRGNREKPEPTSVAAKLVERFDEDGDQRLNTVELFGAVEALHRIGGHKGKRGPGIRGKRGPRGGFGGHSDNPETHSEEESI